MLCNLVNWKTPINSKESYAELDPEFESETNRETSGFDPLLITVLFQIRT